MEGHNHGTLTNVDMHQFRGYDLPPEETPVCKVCGRPPKFVKLTINNLTSCEVNYYCGYHCK